MFKKIASSVTTLFLLNICSLIHAAPWFTGPILAPGGKTIPLGHVNIEFYGFATRVTGTYDNHGKKINTSLFESEQANPIISYGLADWVDAQLSLHYTFNQSQGFRGQHIADTSIVLGFQALTQKPGSWIPNLRIALQEIFPTGRIAGLNPTDKGTGVTGAGANQSVVSLNFQDLTQFSNVHYLRTRLSLAYLYGHPYSLTKTDDFVGPIVPKGDIKPGELVSADLAGEFTMTQNWVAVMEAYSFYHTASSFRGTAGIDENGQLTAIGHNALYEVTLAPALEYNFTENYGLIGGVWFTTNGKSAPVFTSLVLAFNAFW